MNIRQAILRAADHIERNPSMYDFWKTEVPGCGTPGCALGWIGHFIGNGDEYTIQVAERMELPECTMTFYRRMNTLCLEDTAQELWQSSPSKCAKILRRYADKYHPADNFARDLAARLAASPRIAEDA